MTIVTKEKSSKKMFGVASFVKKFQRNVSVSPALTEKVRLIAEPWVGKRGISALRVPGGRLKNDSTLLVGTGAPAVPIIGSVAIRAWNVPCAGTVPKPAVTTPVAPNAVHSGARVPDSNPPLANKASA